MPAFPQLATSDTNDFILVHRFVGIRTDAPISDEENEELGELLELHSARYPPKKLSAWAKRRERRGSGKHSRALAAGQVIQKYLASETGIHCGSPQSVRGPVDRRRAALHLFRPVPERKQVEAATFRVQPSAGATTEVDGITLGTVRG